MLIKTSTDKTVHDAVEALERAVQANHFGIMQVHNLKETVDKKGVEFSRQGHLSLEVRAMILSFSPHWSNLPS